MIKEREVNALKWKSERKMMKMDETQEGRIEKIDFTSLDWTKVSTAVHAQQTARRSLPQY
jgi:hypothetical protein